MKIKTKIRAGGTGTWVGVNHNATLVRAPNVKVKTKIRAGGTGTWVGVNHNATLVRV